jgi:hypothetical protein
MKKIYLLSMMLLLSVLIVPGSVAQEKNKKVMKRFIVERTFSDGFKLAMNDAGGKICQEVVLTNAEGQVTWVHSYFSGDGKKSYCVYDAPSPEAIRSAAKKNNLPVDKITEVRVLDPYFFK